MGLPEQWLADETLFDRVNAEGTRTVARAAREAGVRRLVHTSTEDVFHAEPGERFDESQVAAYPKGTAYERSKQRAEQLALSERDGLEVVIVNPAGVYGPGPERERLLRPGASSSPWSGGGCPRCRPAGWGWCTWTAWPRATCWQRSAAATASATSCATRTSRCGTSHTRWCARPGAAGCRRRSRCRLARAMAAGSEASRASFAGLRCSRADSSTSSPGTLTRSPPRPRPSWAGPARRWPRACAARSRTARHTPIGRSSSDVRPGCVRSRCFAAIL